MKNRSGEKIKLSGIDELLGVVNEEYNVRALVRFSLFYSFHVPPFFLLISMFPMQVHPLKFRLSLPIKFQCCDQHFCWELKIILIHFRNLPVLKK